MVGSLHAATIEVRQQGGDAPLQAEIGSQINMEVVIDTEGEEVTGYSFFLSFPTADLRPVLANTKKPFDDVSFMEGIVFDNDVEKIGDETILSFTKAAMATGDKRLTVIGEVVVARFQVEVTRRPLGDVIDIVVEERGHDHSSHYVSTSMPGTEQRFAMPLGRAQVQVFGFRILSLPDLRLIEGETLTVFDLDDFVDQPGAQVIWISSVLSEIPTVIDAETNQVTMTPRPGFTGRRGMVFTAHEAGDELTAADTIGIDVFARPKITSFRDSVVFAEDTSNQELDLDGFVDDLDDADKNLRWEAVGGDNVQVTINESRGVFFTASPDFFGSEKVIFKVTDSENLEAVDSLIVVVTPVNDPPDTLKVPPAYPVVAGDELRIPLAELAFDRDDDFDNLTFEFSAEDGVLTERDGDDLVLRGETAGRAVVTYTVRDSSGAEAVGRQVVVVLAPGESVEPEISSLPELRFRGGQSGSLDLAPFVRDDSPNTDLAWSTLPDSGLVASVKDGVIQVSHAPGFFGPGNVLLTVQDPELNERSTVLAVQVLRPEDDLGPRIHAPPVIGMTTNAEMNLELDGIVSDPDQQANALTWTSFVSEGLQHVFDEAARSVKIRSRSEARVGALTLTVSDGQQTDTAVIPVLVVSPAANPIVREIPAVSLDTLRAEHSLDLDHFVVDDEDSNAELFWEVQADPGIAAKIDPVSHQLLLRREPTDGLQPSVAQVLLRVVDTSGQATSVVLQVGLPPTFGLNDLPDIEIFAGGQDTSLVLNQLVDGQAQDIRWEVQSGHLVQAMLYEGTSRLRLTAPDKTSTGSQTLLVTGTDQTGRTRSATLRVIVKGRGLIPQIRPFDRIEITEGEVDSLDLDDFVVDDDPDSVLIWSFSGPTTLAVALDSVSHVVTFAAAKGEPGLAQLQFLVRDPLGNVALAPLEIAILRGGLPPVLRPFPKLLIPAGGSEEQLPLDLYVVDEDTPISEINWNVRAGAGVAARLNGSLLVISVPEGNSGVRSVAITATDPQGNSVVGNLQIAIQADSSPPQFTLQIGRHPVFSDFLEFAVKASELLREDPQLMADKATVPVEQQVEETEYRGTFSFPSQQGERVVELNLQGNDRAGNQGGLQQLIALRWMDKSGGRLNSPDLQLLMNVANAAAGPGNLAIVYQLPESKVPPDSEGRPVYAVDLNDELTLNHPVSLNFVAPPQVGLGILRWDEAARAWEELPTKVDSDTGRLSVAVDKLGLFRLGAVGLQSRTILSGPKNFPNPFTEKDRSMKVVYNVIEPGEVKLEVFNLLGQRVRVLIDEHQDIGVWSAAWDGTDKNGNRLASGIYLYSLRANGRRMTRTLLLIR